MGGCNRILFIVAILLCVDLITPALAQGGKLKPLLVKPRIYTPAVASSASKVGKQLFQEHNCASCHSIASVGGCLAPPLDGLGARRRREFLLDRITVGREADFARAYPSGELMPHPRLPEKTAQYIVTYLLTLPEPKAGFAVFGHGSRPEQKASVKTVPVDAKAIAQGKNLYYQHGCAACHAIGSLGGQLAPRLDGISQTRQRQQVLTQITQAEFMTLGSDKEYQERGTIMPPSDLSTDEISKITDFLMSVPRSK